MKKNCTLILLVCLLLASIHGSALAANVVNVSGVAPGNAYIPKGTVIDAELLTFANSGDNDVNDIVYFRTMQNVTVNDIVVLPAGSVGQAVVTTVRRANFFGIGGGIEIRAKYTQALNGAVIPLTLDLKQYGGSTTMYIPAALLGLHFLGFGGSQLKVAGLLRGENQNVPAGTKFQVAVESDADLGCTPDRLAAVMIKLR